MGKKVLFITPDFLPNRHGGTIRLEKLIKYFPHGNIIPIILTKKNGFSKGPEEIMGAKIFRTNNLDVFGWGLRMVSKLKFLVFNRDSINLVKGPAVAASGNSRFSDKLIIPDTDVFWAVNAFFRGLKIIREHKVNVIYSSSPSSSVHITGLLLKRIFPKIPWIVEFRDPWTFNPFRNSKGKILEIIDGWLERKVLERSDRVIVISEHFKDLFISKYPFLEGKYITYIPNGFDSDDFKNIKPNNSQSEYLNIVHTGNFYEKRSLAPFIEAMVLFLKEFPQFLNKIRFTQYGKIDPQAAEQLDLNRISNINIVDTVPHKQSLQAIFGADWVLLIPGPGKGTMTGKIFEYIASKKPILALVDDGIAREIIQKYDLGICISPSDIHGIKNALLGICSDQYKFNPDLKSNYLYEFDRKNIAIKVYEMIQGLG